jgi:peroxiredoxin
MVEVGEMAPDFELAGTTTDGLRLSGLRGQTRAMLIFYPKDRTSG